MRLAFMGTPDFAVPVLQALAACEHEVVMVYSQPPSRSGRGRRERSSPVQTLAEKLNIPHRSPKSLKSDEAQREFADLDPDLAIVVAYGLILPPAILAAPKYGCLNIHASLLPRWRGAAPVHRAIMAGDRETGIDIMVMEEGLDTGPVIMERAVPILPADTTGILQDRLSKLGAENIIAALEGYVSGELVPAAQSRDGVTYAAKIRKSEALVNWTRSAKELRHHIHGLSPHPGAYSMVGEQRVKILAVEITGGRGAPGTLISLPLTIACGDGQALKVIRAQRAGRGPMTAEDLQRGLQWPIGTVFT